MSLPTVHSWRVRYATGGLAALDDRPRSGRPPVHDEEAIIAATLEPPPAALGVTHWSARLLADQLGVSFATVARIWRRWGLKPGKAETFKFSTDPELEAKIRDVVGLYLDPPALFLSAETTSVVDIGSCGTACVCGTRVVARLVRSENARLSTGNASGARARTRRRGRRLLRLHR